MQKQDKIDKTFRTRIIRPMRFALTNDRECQLCYLAIDMIKHVLMRWMVCSHFILAHVLGVVEGDSKNGHVQAWKLLLSSFTSHRSKSN